MAAEPRSLIHLVAAVVGVFRSRVGVAADRCLPSRGRTYINAKPPLEFAKFLKMQNQYAKLMERYFCEFWQKSRMEKQYAKLLEMLLLGYTD